MCLILFTTPKSHLTCPVMDNGQADPKPSRDLPDWGTLNTNSFLPSGQKKKKNQSSCGKRLSNPWDILPLCFLFFQARGEAKKTLHRPAAYEGYHPALCPAQTLQKNPNHQGRKRASVCGPNPSLWVTVTYRPPTPAIFVMYALQVGLKAFHLIYCLAASLPS